MDQDIVDVVEQCGRITSHDQHVGWDCVGGVGGGFLGVVRPYGFAPPWGLRHFAMAYEAKSSLPTYSYPPTPMYQFIASYAMANPINALT